MITFGKLTKEEMLTISSIAHRAKELGHPDDLLTINMDMSAAHDECPMRLDELLKTDDANFLHDVFGIRRHINRETGKLEDCFLPRFAR